MWHHSFIYLPIKVVIFIILKGSEASVAVGSEGQENYTCAIQLFHPSGLNLTFVLWRSVLRRQEELTCVCPDTTLRHTSQHSTLILTKPETPSSVGQWGYSTAHRPKWHWQICENRQRAHWGTRRPKQTPKKILFSESPPDIWRSETFRHCDWVWRTVDPADVRLTNKSLKTDAFSRHRSSLRVSRER